MNAIDLTPKFKYVLEVFRRHLSLGVILALPVSAVYGQVKDVDKEELIELSPFTVDASNDTGYRATSTLAGTRLNTALRDIAASVTVVTEDFMNDIGATDMEGILTYLGSTETGGMDGNYHGGEIEEGNGGNDVHRIDSRPQQSYRVRGLAKADTTQNYFITAAPLDSFNFDQVTVNRGPNSALFGLGSAGGVLNAGLKKAQFRDFAKIETTFDDWGTKRYVLDVNKQLVEDKLSVRFTALYNDKGYEQKNAYNLDRRQYGAITFKPFKNTVIRANYTSGFLDRSLPISRPPEDNMGIWASFGKPLWDPVTAEFYASREDFAAGTIIPRSISDTYKDGYDTNRFSSAKRDFYAILFPNPDSAAAGGPGTPEFIRTSVEKGKDAWPNYPKNGAKAIGMIDWKNTRNIWDEPIGSFPGARGFDAVTNSFYQVPYIQDRDVFDYRKQSVYGPNRLNTNDFDSFSATLEQTFLGDKVGFEVSIYEESFRDDYLQFQGQLNIDSNLRYVNGEPNPNVGRAYIGGNEYSEPQFSEIESQRITAFAEFDFADHGNDGWVSKLGKHVFTGLLGVHEADNRTETHKGTFLDPSILAFDRGQETLRRYTEGRVYRASYLGGPNQLDVDGIQGITGINVLQLPPVNANDILTWDNAEAARLYAANPNYNYADAFTHYSGTQVNNYLQGTGLTFHGANTRTHSEVKSLSTVLQSYFFNGNLVTAASWRKDSIELARGQYNPDPVSRVTSLGSPPLDEFTDLGDVTATSFSVVGHVPRSLTENFLGNSELSFHYVNSSNTEAKGGNVDLFGRALGLPSGVTDEYGMSFRSGEGKLALRLNFYDSSEEGSILKDVGGFHKIELNMLEFNTDAELAAAGYTPLGDTFNNSWNITKDAGQTDEITGADGVSTVILNEYEEARNPGHIQQFTTGDTTSKGMEIELTYNPTRNWRIAFNVSKIKAVKSNLAGPELEYLDQRLAFWNSPGAANLWMDNERWDEDAGAPNDEARLINPVTGALHDDILGSMAEVAFQTALDGFPVPELRKWRANFITNFTFSDAFPGFLKGFSVGGAIRWEDKLAAGYALKEDTLLGWKQDLDNIYYAPAQTSVDLWLSYSHRFEKTGINWRLRLGARNITSDEGLLDTRFNPDGSRGAFRIEPGKRFELSNSFTF
jgi:outer membrane receptor protein involved in Fe transport